MDGSDNGSNKSISAGSDTLAFFLGDGYLPLSDSASSVRPQPEVGRLVVTEARMRSLEQESLLQLSCGLTETRT